MSMRMLLRYDLDQAAASCRHIRKTAARERTPLNAILGFSEMIASRTMVRDVGKHYEYAELIHDSARHLLALINDILDL
ncbi:MAG: PAS domain-containing sensor histidine kinase, partial [Alphaproteobacteria bacterium]|nr:PAS domain-containing sensor histidine kinase [Alphaproteobacteria bacterium]